MIEPILTTTAMQAADRRTIEEHGVPGFTLMETAGRAAFRTVAASFGPIDERTVTVFAGKGNNGGDGMVVSRLLFAHGARVRLVTLGEEDSLRDDPRRNLRFLRALTDHDDDGRLTIEPFAGVEDLDHHRSSDLYIDALLGTGLTSDLRSPILEIVEWLNEQPVPVAALDVPTGLNSDLGVVHGAAVRADLTVTMAARKTGLLLNEGPHHSGRTDVAEIGVPSYILREAGRQKGCAAVASDQIVREWLPERTHDDHKYSVGMVVALAGSPGLTGAPVLASRAAARAGAGAVVCACPTSVQPTLAHKLTEVMTLGLPETDDGTVSSDALDHTVFRRRIEKARALLVGCGLGRHAQTQTVVHQLIRAADVPTIVDADGLNALIGHTELLTQHADRRVVLTPHAGEFQRLADADVDLTDRIRTAVDYARRWNSILLLKGMPGIVASPDGRTFINTTGSPALASAGTGDVLAGICAGLAAQGLSPFRAAVSALRIGGAAADAYEQTGAGRSLLATDVIDLLPSVLHTRFSTTSPRSSC